MGDVRLLLDGALALPGAAALAPAPTARRLAVPIVAAALLASAVTGAIVWFLSRPDPQLRTAMRFEIGGRAAEGIGASISPDGRVIGFLDVNPQRPRLVAHSLESGETKEIEGVAIVGRAGPAFWSPDSRSSGLWIDGKVVRVDLAGGAPQTLAEATGFGGGAWGPGDVILFAAPEGIKRVPASGGTVVAVTTVDGNRGESNHLVPAFLPDGQHFLYVRESTDAALSGVYVGRIDAAPDQQDLTRLLTVTTQTVFVPEDGGDEGHLLYLREGVLTAQPFNGRTRSLTGEPVSVVDQRITSLGAFAMFSVSDTGTIAYRAATSPVATLVAVTRTGERETLLGGLNIEGAMSPRLSPDGRRVVLVVDGDLWSYDLGGRPPIKLTFDGDKFSPLWTPDGTRVVYEQGGSRLPTGVFSVPADGSGGAPAAAAPKGHFHPHGWAFNGDLVAVRLEGNNVDVVRFPPRADGAVQPVQQTPALEGVSAAISADGRWLAYTADATGRGEIWVRSLAAPGAPVRVSPNGGSDPMWARSGRELYYREGDRVMAVAVEPGADFDFRAPVELFSAPMSANTQPPVYDIDASGRFIFLAPDDARDAPITVILNWSELLRNRAAAQ